MRLLPFPSDNACGDTMTSPFLGSCVGTNPGLYCSGIYLNLYLSCLPWTVLHPQFCSRSLIPTKISYTMPCFGSRKRSNRPDTEPLLAQYDENTALQRKAHGKLHTYQMLRALSKGYFPSTEQTIVQLRTLLSADILNPTNTQLTADGRKFVRHVRKFITEFIELLQEKNGQDQLQEFLWCAGKARVGLDAQDLVQTATNSKARADARAGNKQILITFPFTVADMIFV